MHQSAIFIIQLLIKKDLNFAVYRLPDETKIRFVVQRSDKLQSLKIKKIDRISGFVIASFDCAETGKMYMIQPDYVFFDDHDTEDIIKEISALPDRTRTNYSFNESMSKHDYLDRANFLLKKLREGSLRKVVLSRIIEKPLPHKFDLAQFYFSLIQNYPHAFVYLFNLSGIGTWLGATPESLLRLFEDHAETMALAGTKPADRAKWTEKEIKEQQIVTDYIEELLFNHGITEYGKTMLTTQKAGNVVHLKTGFNISLEQIKSQTGKVLLDFHPTPAVCGLPRDKAYKLIKQIEKHDRRFYSGFLGPWNIEDQSQLFVNLRCAEIGESSMNVYVGGGLTADSDPEAEWEETLHKSKTILSVLENL